MSISCAETAGMFVANTWLAKHLIFSSVSICQQWKQPWAQPCGISTENKRIIPSAFGRDCLPLSSCSQVQPSCQSFHSSGWQKHIPVQNLAARITRLLLPKMLQRHSVFYPQGMLANCPLYPRNLCLPLFLPTKITFEDNNRRLKYKNSLSFCTLPFSREIENPLLCLDMCECQSGDETLVTSWWWVTVTVFPLVSTPEELLGESRCQLCSI